MTTQGVGQHLRKCDRTSSPQVETTTAATPLNQENKHHDGKTNIHSVSDVDAEIAETTNAVQDLETKVINGDTMLAVSKAREKLRFLGLRRTQAAEQEENCHKAIDGYQVQVAEWSIVSLSEMPNA